VLCCALSWAFYFSVNFFACSVCQPFLIFLFDLDAAGALPP
jgi:hypothetical protein